MFRFTSQFDKLLEKATSNLLMEADWATILQIGDLIRQNDVQPKYALAAVKKKIASPNPHTAMFAVQLLESMVKNCGPALHDELTTTTYCASLQELVRGTTHDNVQQKLLELIQAWTFAFRKNPKYGTLKDAVNALKSEGYKFPAMRESDAMFTADSAPSWCDGEVCHRCRTQFNLVLRKHHCRACGQVFCKACTTKSCTLPKFGIEKEVRVCDACYEQVNKPASSTSAAKDADMEEYLKSSLAQQSQVPPRKSEEEIREEEELQLALALSQSEAEHKEKEKMRVTSAYFTFKDSPTAMKDLETVKRSPSPTEDNSNPELARYLNRSYWENRQTDSIEQGSIASPSAPAKEPSIASSGEMKIRENGIVDQELEEFVKTLKSQVEIFINRMKSNSSRGRSIANDSSVQTLFMNITAMHSKLLRYIQQHDDSRLLYERLQDKLAQVKDARAALDALRDEHREKLRRQAEEAERQRQLLMAHKLDIMRKKKQEYLQYQRQVALQRIQEQEREMQMRQEQQKQQYMMGSLCFMGSPVHGQQFPSNVAPPSGNYGYQYGMPTMVGHPQGMGQLGHPQNSMQGPPVYPPGYMPNQNIPPPQGHPLNMQQPPPGLPPNMQPPPQSLPSNMQAPPQNMQAPPQSMQQPPQGLPPNMPQNMPPQNMQQSLPTNMQGPQSMAPQNMQPPQQSLPLNMNVQNMMPQNGPQNQVMMQQPGMGYHGQQQQQQQQETSPKQMVQPKEEAQIAELIKFD